MNQDSSGASEILIRNVIEDDQHFFFEQQLDLDANNMAAFTRKNPSDRKAFDAHWTKIMSDKSIIIKTILYDGQVAGYVLKYEISKMPEVSFWLGKEYWGKDIATQALSLFLKDLIIRPVIARAAKDNIASIRVLEKCGFTIIGIDKGYANARHEEIEEVVLELK